MSTATPPVPTCVWTGKSGTKYTFHAYPILQIFNANQDGNYIFAILENGAYRPIYIGEGNLADRSSDQHHKYACIKSRGATHFHAQLNGVEKDRKAEESDLLAAYTQAYAPTGCNEKIGG